MLHSLFLASRPMTLGVRAIALDFEDRVLLVRHTYVEGWWLPGGGVEAGQTSADALQRESREEANCVLAEPPTLLSVHLNRIASRRDHVMVYVCRNVSQSEPKKADLEVTHAEFFALDNLPSDINPASGRRLREFLEGSPPDPYW